MNAKKCKAIRQFLRQPQYNEDGVDMVPGEYAMFASRSDYIFHAIR